jgi:all-trans-retinol dehydrogenase (NAD+)
MAVIEPYVVADAVVKQVLSGRGRQLILAPGVEFLSTMRSWPSWFTRALNGLTGT